MYNFGIVVPMYNVEKYIKDCIVSLKEQTIKDFQVIIVDDGSTDQSKTIAVQTINGDKRFTIISQVNQGLPAARNTGLNYINSEYIIFLDSDDILEPQTLEEVLPHIKEKDIDLCIFNMDQFSINKIFKGSRYTNNVLSKTTLDYYILALDSCCNKVFKTSIIRKNFIQFESKKLVPQEDFLFNFKYLYHSSKIKTLSSSYYKYRMRQGSITKNKVNLNDALKSLDYSEHIGKYNEIHGSQELFGFEQYTKIVMLFSIINQKGIKASQIFEVYKFYNKKFHRNHFNLRAIIKYSEESKHFLYYLIVLLLLKVRMFRIVSLLESKRVNKLSKINKNDLDLF